MRSPSIGARVALAVLVAVQACVSGVASADHLVARLKRLVGEAEYSGTPPHTGADSSMEALAENIDWLEHYIDTYGSVVAKQPDIWGQARLTKHRDEYERVMFGELGGFQHRINAQVTQADTAFFAQAMALSTAASATPPTVVAPSAAGAITASTAGIEGVDAVQLEPVIHLDQLSRYVQHLHELRRISEGDDTSDSPGYSLNLIRIPISIMPGKLTRKGFGAEVTITATPVLSEDLMPTTFRNLVLNDLVDQLGLPLVRTVEDEKLIKARELFAHMQEAQDQLSRLKVFLNEERLEDDQETRSTLRSLIVPLLNNPSFRDSVNTLVRMIKSGRATGLCRIGKYIQDPTLSVDDGSPEYVAKKYADFLTLVSLYAEGGSKRLQHLCLAQDAFLLAVVTQQTQLDQAAVSSQAADKFLQNVTQSDLEEKNPEILFNELKDHYGALLANEPLLPASLDLKAKMDQVQSSGLSVKRVEALRKEGLTYGRKFAASADAQKKKLEELDQELRLQLLPELSVSLDQISNLLNDSVSTGVFTQMNGSGRARNARHPLPPSQVVDVYGFQLFLHMAEFFCPSYSGRQVRWAGDPKCSSTAKVKEYRVDLLDAQKWLGAEVAAAYELLSQPEHVGLWYELARAESGLATAIRAGHTGESGPGCVSIGRGKTIQLASCESIGPGCVVIEDELAVPVSTSPALAVAQFRQYFLAHLHEHHPQFAVAGHKGNQVLDHLAWAIVVESALLNQRLNDDIRKLARAKQAPQLDMGRDFNFFIPDTVLRPNLCLDELRIEFEEASAVFQEYVRVRWPIHVFALDPREQDQNVADASARRRELQFAMSLAFVTGQVGANSLTQFARTLETEVQTIGLNRTAAAFSHGRDTFGWRFQPRVQALEAPGTFGALKQTVCGINPDADLVSRELEPGMREAVAVVIMPSFVPYVDFDIRTNWYKLDNPKNAALTMKDTMRLSRAVTAMRHSRANCAEYQHLYREGELRRLLARVDQLDRELPLQTLVAQAPYENTLGGFEMFNTGVTDLAPELIGWYGAPGIVTNDDVSKNYTCGCTQCCQKGGLTSLSNTEETTNPLPICEGQGTTVFLVGDNFSVHDTKVIAGGVCIPHVQLVSREIMRVVIPSCVNKVEVDGKEYVAVYAATPYGVTNHLHVPVVARSLAAETKAQIATAVASEVKAQLAGVNVGPPDLSLRFDSPSQIKLVLEAFCPDGDPGKLSLKAIELPKVHYSVALPVKHVNDYEFSASIFRKGYLFPLIPLETQLQQQGQISPEEMRTYLEKVFRSQPAPIEALARALSYTDLADDGKDSASLVIYMQPKSGRGTELPTRFGEIPIEVRLACACCEESPLRLTATMQGAGAPSPSTARDCNCGGAAPASGNRGTASPTPVPAASGSALGEPISETSPSPGELGISSTATIRTFVIPTPPAVPPADGVATPAGSSPESPAAAPEVIPVPPLNIQLQFPPPQPNHHRSDHRLLDGPVSNEYKARATECWRNVRDQVPGPYPR